jgi:hypothetical protein
MSTKMNDLHAFCNPIMKLLDSCWDMDIVYLALPIFEYLLNDLLLLEVIYLLDDFTFLHIDQGLTVHEQK